MLIGIEEEPSAPPQIVPNFAQDNTYSFTISSLEIAVRPVQLSIHCLL